MSFWNDSDKVASHMVCEHLVVRGIVQGVGFRPFVFRLAQQLGLRGWVANTGNGVEIEINGSAEQVAEFTERLQEPPPLALIDELLPTRLAKPDSPEPGFVIKKSAAAGKNPGPLPPDADICPACLAELFDPHDPRYLYPFINCTDCGPRYTVIENIPYDRSATTMKGFELCPRCEKEYNDPYERRFHAQTNCCPACGPHYTLCDKQGKKIAAIGPDAKAIEAASRLLQDGKIVAIKGIGGFHLVADARNQKTVQLLRKRKRRPDKPLAVMAASYELVAEVALGSSQARKLLVSGVKPIVILRKKSAFPLADSVAPGSVFIGIMLPYSPLHHLLFRDGNCDFLVMTSGNSAGSPIIRDNQSAFEKLAQLADYFLVHDRDILISNDDSVVRSEGGRTVLIRRSRSYTPGAIKLHREAGKTLAFGAMLKNTICITRGKAAFFSHHIGELENPDTVAYLKTSVEHFSKSLRIKPELLGCDLHPEYPSTILAKEYSRSKGLPLVQVQHHHAHAVSCMAEHGLDGPVLAVVLDGNGWGLDGTVWGGELLLVEASRFERVGHLLPVPMPGGDAAVLQPWRMALSYLYGAYQGEPDWENFSFLKKYQAQLPLLLQMLAKQINSPLTSSCGRLFDAMAVLLGICTEASFEGQAAASIEMCAFKDEKNAYPIALASGAEKGFIFDTLQLIRAVIADQGSGVPQGIIAARFQNTLAAFFGESCKKLRQHNKINQVVLSGGVFQNLMFTNILQEHLDSLNFSVYTHEKTVPGDGGIALGQAVSGQAQFLRKFRS